MDQHHEASLSPQLSDIFAAMHPKEISIADYSYELPDEKIAKYPLPVRDHSKLLVWKNASVTESRYIDLPKHLPAGSLLVFNESKVVEARLLFQKPTGATVEVFCLEPDSGYPDIATALGQHGSVKWKCMIGGASKWKHGMVLHKTVDQLQIDASITDRSPEAITIELKWNQPELSFAEVLHLAGAMPLPPYLHREAEPSDLERYQTIYAKQEGSVAAPTAGLHFTERLFNKLEQQNIHRTFVTLHVGAGTFKPVKAAKMEAHEMHAEFIDVPLSFIETLLHQRDAPVVAVGTTSLRTIESLYWLAVKLQLGHDKASSGIPVVEQWEPYELPSVLSASEALQILLDWMTDQGMERLFTQTRIIIAPGYELKIAGGLLTNFHQPHSTLLLLVAAVAGERWKQIYEYALQHDFRFLSYGDGCLIWKH
ncbi:MAG TPA: S-adenosylmethionine:tRNA ribosyltransferase-isomerase [Chitinophagaceae bacterium]